LTWPYEKETPTVDNWQNGWGFTFDPQRSVVMWQTSVGVNNQTFEQWDLDTRAYLRSGDLDDTAVGEVNPGPQRTFGLAFDGTLYAPTETSGTFLKKFVEYALDGTAANALQTEGDPDFLANPDHCRLILLGDQETGVGSVFVVMPSYSTGSDGLIWDVTGAAMTFLDVSAFTGTNGQIKGFVHQVISGASQVIWALVVNGDLTANQVGLWQVATLSGGVDPQASLQIVDVSATQGSTNGLADGVYMEGAFYVLAGHGTNQKLCRIDPDTWAETHAIDGSDIPTFASEHQIEVVQAEAGGTTFMIGNQRRSLADLTLLTEYPYSNWGFTDIQIVNSVWDPTNEAIFVSFADGDIGWLFFPEIRRVHGHIRYGEAR
jgi:hypothetical protein